MSNPNYPKPPVRNGSLHTMIGQTLASAAAVRESRRKNRLVMWHATKVGGFAVCAVLACLEGLNRELRLPEVIGGDVRKDKVVEAKLVLPETVVVSPQATVAPVVPVVVTPEPVVPEVPAAKMDGTVADNTPTESQLIDKEKPLVLVGQDAAREMQLARYREIVKQVIDGQAWAV